MCCPHGDGAELMKIVASHAAAHQKSCCHAVGVPTEFKKIFVIADDHCIFNALNGVIICDGWLSSVAYRYNALAQQVLKGPAYQDEVAQSGDESNYACWFFMHF